MNRWGTRNQEENTPNFKELFNTHPHAADLLSLPDFAEDAKTHSTTFTQLLLAPKNLHYLFELIEIAINPQHFTTTTMRTLNNKMTHAAIEILTNLSEDFMDSVFQGEEDHQDEVIQTERDYPILTTIFKIAGKGQLQSTSLAYFSKIVTPFIYQKPAEMISFFSQQAMPLVIRYFWSSEMCELATKVLQAETESHFFQTQKVSFVRKLTLALENFEESSTLEETMESLSSFMQALVDKHQDKYERSKYASLLSKIVQQPQTFSFLIGHLEKYKTNSVIKSQLLHCLQAYLKIHLPPPANGKGEDSQSQPQPIKLNANMADALQMYLSNNPVTHFISDIRMQLINYYKMVKLFLAVSPQSTDSIVTAQFLNDTFKLMKKQQNNNILHNLQRQLIIKALSTSAKVHHTVKYEIGLLNQLKSNICQTNCKSSYATQIFLISEAALKQNHITTTTTQAAEWNALDQQIANKRQFLAKPIASNKDNQDEQKWDNFESEIIIKTDNITENTSKLVSLMKPRLINNEPFTMVTRLDEIEGTQVLSEEEEDGFGTSDPTKTNHFYDDLGMPELPLDSDKSEEGELKNESLENIPQNVTKNSAVNLVIPGEQDFPETLNENSQNEGQHLSTDQFGLPDTLRQLSSKKIDQVEQEKTTGQIYMQNIGPQVEEFQFNPTISQLVQPKEELRLEGPNQMTVSIDIAEEVASAGQGKVRHREEIEAMLYARYQLELTELKK